MALVGESGPGIGLGHIRRLSMLGKECLRRRGECTFYLASFEDADLVRSWGFQASPWRGPESLGSETDAVCLDGYGFDVGIQSQIREKTDCLLVVDDHAERPLCADIIVNHNIYAETLRYSLFEGTTLLAGPAYALIDPAFAGLRRTPRTVPENILISLGGTDDGEKGEALANATLESRPAATVELVIAPRARARPMSPDLARKYGDRLRVHHGANMVELMGKANVYAGAAGVTLLEAMAAGLEIVACMIADNQSINIVRLRELGLVAFDRFDPLAMASAIGSNRRTTALPEVDGNGAARCIDQVLARLKANRAKSHSGT